MKKFDLIKTEGFERVYHDKKTGREAFSTERFSGEYIVNHHSVCYKSESGGKVPQQFLDSRWICPYKSRQQNTLKLTTHAGDDTHVVSDIPAHCGDAVHYSVRRQRQG